MINIDKPRDHDIHTLCDYAELICLLTEDRTCSREAISDQGRDVGETEFQDNFLDDCFNQIQWRVKEFGEFYPFSLSAHARSFSAPELLTEKQNLYALILLCANLPFVQEKRGSLTEAFERISFLALKTFWPAKGTVKPFGKNESEFTGTKWERINKLADEIGGIGSSSASSFRKGDSGDGGIDIAAWMTFDSSNEKRNIMSALAQCACSRTDWSSKQSEISFDRLSNLIHPTHRWNQILFIPQCFRDNRGFWAVPGEIGQTILFDRLRIISQFSDSVNWSVIAPPEIFQTFLEKRFDLV